MIMYISSIKFKDFRNFKEETITFSPKVNVIIGENAQGKTNLIEGIYITSMGKSFRTVKDKDMIAFGKEYCRIHGEFSDHDTETVDIILGKDGKKAAKIDGHKVEKTSELLSNVVCVVFSPEDLKIIKEDPAKRRSFIDRELSRISVAYLENIKKYKKALQQRNSLLKNFMGNSDDSSFLAAIGIWDDILAESGAAVMKKRNSFIYRLSTISGLIHQSITRDRETLDLVYSSNIPFEKDAAVLSIKEKIIEILNKNRKADIERGTTTHGPHRDDMDVYINGVNTRHFGSQGQQRTAALSLKLAEIDIIRTERGYNPILLLDDVLSELDPYRQKYMVETLKEVQLMITTTELTQEVKNFLSYAKMVHIENGAVTEG